MQIYPTPCSTSLLKCLMEILSSTSPRWESSFPLASKPLLPAAFPIPVGANSTRPSTQVKTLDIILLDSPLSEPSSSRLGNPIGSTFKINPNSDHLSHLPCCPRSEPLSPWTRCWNNFLMDLTVYTLAPCRLFSAPQPEWSLIKSLTWCQVSAQSLPMTPMKASVLTVILNDLAITFLASLPPPLPHSVPATVVS